MLGQDVVAQKISVRIGLEAEFALEATFLRPEMRFQVSPKVLGRDPRSFAETAFVALGHVIGV